MNDITLEEKCKIILRESFFDSSITEEELAGKIGVTRRTIENWINGKSFPTFPQLIKWFSALNARMLPYLMKMFYIGSDREVKNKKVSTKKRKEDLIEYFNSLDDYQIEQLHFVFCGKHGSAPDGQLQRYVADLQVPLKDRVNVATLTVRNYEYAKKKGTLTCPDEAQPDLDLLKESINKGWQAVLNDETGYSNLGGEDHEA